MKLSVKRSTIVEGISFLFIILFLYTGISKWLEIDVFEEQLSEVPLLEPVSWWVVWLLPPTEFVISVLLFWPAWRRKGLYATLVLMTLFTGYILYIFTIDKELPCSCGGIMEQLSWEGHLIFNSIMIALTITAIGLSRKPAGSPPSDHSPVVYS